MSIIDRYAYYNRLRSVDPAYKAGLALVVLLVCLAADRPLVGVLTAVWMGLLAVLLAGLPARVWGRVLLAELFFLVLASLGIAFDVTLAGQAGGSGLWTLHVGPLAVISDPQRFNSALHAVSRSLGATSALNFLALTTPLADLVNLFRRLRVPVLLIDLMTVTYRFIFILFDSLRRIYTAQCCRLGYSSPSRSLASAGRLGSRLFIDAYRRSQRLQVALDARCFDRDLRVLPRAYATSPALLIAGAIAIANLVIVRIVS